MQIKWTDIADQDLGNIESHITEDRDSLVALDVVINIINSAELILSQYPRAGRQGRVKNTRELVIEGIPFVLVYRENRTSNSVEILRVLPGPSSSQL